MMFFAVPIKYCIVIKPPLEQIMVSNKRRCAGYRKWSNYTGVTPNSQHVVLTEPVTDQLPYFIEKGCRRPFIPNRTSEKPEKATSFEKLGRAYC